ncbi:MAG: transcription-repair coupling factor [Pyrinomonadaceae bacterium]
MPTIDSKIINKLRDELSRGVVVQCVSGLTSIAAKAFAVSELRRLTGKRITVLTGANRELEQWERDLAFWNSHNTDLAHDSMISIPAFESDPYAGLSPHPETLERRALGLWRLARDEFDFCIVPGTALATRVPGEQDLKSLGMQLSVDRDFAPEDLVVGIEAVGYKKEEPIANIGEFSVRGGILDIWPPNSEYPFRIEFFGDTVDSIRTFDPDTQLSVEVIKEALIAPMSEFRLEADDLVDWAKKARAKFEDEHFSRNLRDRTDFADEGETFPGWEFLLPLVRPLTGSIFEPLKNTILVVDEPNLVEADLKARFEQLEATLERTLDEGDIALNPETYLLPPDTLRNGISSFQRIEFRSLGMTSAARDEEFTGESDSEPLFLFPAVEGISEIHVQSRASRKFTGQMRALAKELKEKGSEGKTFVFKAPGLAERFSDILRDYEYVLSPSTVLLGDLSSGFEIPTSGIEVITETDIFGEDRASEFSSPASNARTRRKTAAFISDFRDLKPGDFVVHVDHGIGRFEGLETISAQGMEREFVLLVYADKAKLFVPVERLDLVSRYASGENANPALDRLGGIGWQKTKAKAKREMRDMADELLRLYAERKLVQGFAFSADAPWQKEFEDAFPYNLTPDQATSIEEVKTDMEKAVPMDRLIVGDVGYGKTEVAMRAAFKAVMDGKQVAVLAPTTVLAFQHNETFKQRFSAFPIKTDLLSRFRNSKEQKEVVGSVSKGELDILIGTHRILSNDVEMPNLGLVIVDEEQRFGVAHKEKLKQLRKKVDVLTLSATPIPRTLNMAMSGLRDMSVIETPPRDRLAINTQVVQFSEHVIKSAVELELAREGQVFFIHNRVQTIEAIAAHIKRLVPNARILVGHGQMSEKELERVMFDFVEYKYDVLVATTIIENGIDIPRANTILINRADNYGLSQLYQLRGRVGRSNRRAYSYLLIPAEQELTPIARRRLSAIREFSDLGAGFRIAALDLELRGAGNILGGQQSGQMDALGFDLYTKMLNRTIQELRGEEIEDEASVSINLGIDVSIPQDYIQDTSQRLRTYKRISSASGEDELIAIFAEIEDRYGSMPESVRALFEFARLRREAETMRVLSVDRAADCLAIKLGENSRVNPERLMSLLERTEGAQFSPNGILRVPISISETLSEAKRILAEIN